MISISGLTYYIGSRPIYEDASLFIKEHDKIGLIGLNGAGKSTLLKIINGEITPEKGKINRSNETTLGFLNQDMLSYSTEESILSVAMQAFEDTIEMQKKIDHILKQMETNYTDDLLEKLSNLQEKFTALGGYEAESKAEKVLEGIGFKTSDLSRPISEFSGGWRMRVILAKLLLQKPSLLMLDEPTNHLDIVSIKWLEGYLNSYDGAYIVISHDRSFLDKICNNIVEVSGKKLPKYTGNFTSYEKEKSLNQELQHNAFINQQKKIKETQEFINRFRAKASKASQVQSRVKALEKLEKIEDVASAPKTAKIKFKINQNPGKEIVEINHLNKAYDNIEIFKDADAKIKRGDRIALIGANGKGKSTMLKLIAGTEKAEGGDVNLGHNVDFSFYAQHQLESLNVENDVFTELKTTTIDRAESEIRAILGMLLFSKDDVKKKIKVLSGGEKARVALAKMMMSGANFLLLDEPTNHLDMISIEILASALENYEGTFILVSHNEYFIKRLANKIWYIEDKKIKEYPDNYEAFEYWLKSQNKKL
ncbi:MAG: ABC-F family ATP-binding cassette domain-containing protein [Bacteroidetes bacterium]|nr:ABC-F family ATP-binding cassette domain-containing protein [Bacteroidota bacterium]